MKCLTVRQPWAWAILEAGKDIENRDWPTSVRGRVAIHAAKGMTRDEYEEFYFFIRYTQELLNAIHTLPAFEKLIRGSVIGTVEIVDCVRQSSSLWFQGDYGFVLRDPVLFKEPIPCRGQLGFWDFKEQPK